MTGTKHPSASRRRNPPPSPIDLWDVQGNVVRSYGRAGYPHARHMFLHIGNPKAGRDFLSLLYPFVTTGIRWDPASPDPERHPPQVALNIGFTWHGLRAVGLPTQSLAEMPEEFMDGMGRRAPLLGDEGASDPSNWDPIWRASMADPAKAVHLWVALNARMDPATGQPVPLLQDRVTFIRRLAASLPGMKLLSGHDRDAGDVQDAALDIRSGPDGRLRIAPQEHFGFVDGIGDPIFHGQGELAPSGSHAIGRGRYSPRTGWGPLAPGEFLLGHVDESQEIAPASHPFELTRNGTFAVYRKLEQDVAAFDAYIAEKAPAFARARGIPEDQAAVTIKAMMVGRWPNGAPLATVPTYEGMLAFEREWADIPDILARPRPHSPQDHDRLGKWKMAMNGFLFQDDRDGLRCPLGAHIRRGFPRDMLDPMLATPTGRGWTGTALTNRRRMLRRGIPYGPFGGDPGAERGLLFIALCSDLRRQFEFVQQQWMNHGMDFGSGNDTCPILGMRSGSFGYTIPAPADGSNPPHFLTGLPDFVRTRGGDYFFLPSVTALHKIFTGTSDPT